MSIKQVRLSNQAKEQLIRLKMRTGIPHWNVLCRWAFCLSISDPTSPRALQERNVGAIEMTWKTFAGDDDELYRILLIRRSAADLGKTDREALGKTIRQHIARGTARLVANRGLKSTRDLIELALGADQTEAVDVA